MAYGAHANDGIDGGGRAGDVGGDVHLHLPLILLAGGKGMSLPTNMLAGPFS